MLSKQSFDYLRNVAPGTSLTHCVDKPEQWIGLAAKRAALAGRAAEAGWLQTRRYGGGPWCASDAIYAAERGFLDVLEMAHSQGYLPFYHIMYAAAEYGRIRVLKWAHAILRTRLPHEILFVAVMNDRVHVIAWVLRQARYMSDEVMVRSFTDGITMKMALQKSP